MSFYAPRQHKSAFREACEGLHNGGVARLSAPDNRSQASVSRRSPLRNDQNRDPVFLVLSRYILYTRVMQIWVDADACPGVIKEILYRAATPVRQRFNGCAVEPCLCPAGSGEHRDLSAARFLLQSIEARNKRRTALHTRKRWRLE